MLKLPEGSELHLFPGHQDSLYAKMKPITD